MSKKTILAELLCLEEANILAYSLFINYGYLQNRGCGWWGAQTLGNHTYLMPSNYDLKG